MVERGPHSSAVFDFQECTGMRMADTHVIPGVCNIPEVTDGVLEWLFLELRSAWFGVEGLDLGIKLILRCLDLLACLFLLGSMGSLVVAAAVKD